MIKFLITSALVYFIYRFFIAPPAIDEQGRSREQEPAAPKEKRSYEDEYIDYEEVD